jgi:hypothetical protein
MSSRSSFWLVALLLAGLVLLRAFPFVWWAGTDFDSDQAIVGLMAKHISEGRAFPLYYYGQNYMLAVEAYLAAPAMLVAGPTVMALKTPLVLINIATVVLLLRILVRDARLPPPIAAIAVLPLALPAAGVAARVTEANGGNVEPWLYVLVLWMVRERPWWLGIVLGFSVLHREFAGYGALAWLILDALRAFAAPQLHVQTAALAQRWAVTGIAVVGVHAVARVVQPFASALGPGTRGDDPALLGTVVDTFGGRLCFEPAAWFVRAGLLTGDHLPRLVGGLPAPLRDYGVLSGVYSGVAGVGLWVGGLTTAGLAAGAWYWWRSRRGLAAGEPPEAMPHVGGYLVLVATISTLIYGFATCSDIKVETMRYNLLGVFLPVGALTMALQTWSAAPVRAGSGAAVALWCLLNTSDVLALWGEYLYRTPVDQRQVLADELQRRGVVVASSRFRHAYHITFLAQERVRVAANDFSRIRAYFDEAALAQAPTLAERPCADGDALPPACISAADLDAGEQRTQSCGSAVSFNTSREDLAHADQR